MSAITSAWVESDREKEYRATYVRCLRAQQIDRWAFRIVYSLLVTLAVSAALRMSILGSSAMAVSRTCVATETR
jgi:hypothetical protein